LLSELTLRKRKLCEYILNKDSALYKLKKTYKGKKLKKVCDGDNDRKSFSSEAARFLAAILRNRRQA
jgi:hypothetical protein